MNHFRYVQEFQEHQVMSHGNSLYRASVQVPFLIVYPGRLSPGEIVPDPVSLRDIPATVLDLIGISNGATFPGNSLTRYMDASDPLIKQPSELILNEVTTRSGRPNFYPIFEGDMKAIETNGMRYILRGDGSEELFDSTNDPEELHDLAGTPEGQAVLPEIRDLLNHILAQPGEPAPLTLR